MAERVTKKEMQEDLKRFKAFDAMALSDGGKELKSLCLKDVVSSIDTLAGGFKEMSHIEMIAHCARLNERLSLYRVLVNAKANVSMTEQAIKEATEEEPD